MKTLRNNLTLPSTHNLVVDSWSAHAKEVLVAGILNTIATIWCCRNNLRFDGIKLSVLQALNRIKLVTSTTGNCSTLLAKPSVLEFSILKAFHVSTNFNKAPLHKEVIWDHPCLGWVKINTDGAAKGSLGHAGGRNL
ncbi:hypothetical protein Lal_00038778 [Lupinus albus]|nr:hypothetical protein Lal_00038778 [Lupinus albus]